MTTHTIIGSKFIPYPKTSHLKKLNDDHNILATFILDRNCTSGDIEMIIDYCTKNNLSAARRNGNIIVSGSAADFNKLLQIELQTFTDDDARKYHAPMDDIRIPIQWQNKVTDILGLNTRRVVDPCFKLHGQSRAISTLNPLQLARLYNFPTNLDGTGQKIGIIELGGGYVLSDITTYFSNLGINAVPNVHAISVDGVVNDPTDTSGANVEVILDIEVIAAIVPKATINVYFGLNSDAGFYNAIAAAIQDGCGIVSISWGAPEIYWSSSTLTTYNNLFQYAATQNVTILAAAGDNGSSDGVSGRNVDFPASSPYVLACGGTRVEVDTSITTITRETVWNNNSQSSATGGGLSSFFSRPSYQSGVLYNLNNRRGVPDVAGNADPTTGYRLYYDGQNIVVGGTSAVSPLWSALLARINQSIGHNVGFINPTIYSHTNVCRDITVGNNGAYAAATGWDPCTGWGPFNGIGLLNLFAPPAPAVQPVAAFTGIPVSGSAPLTVVFTDQSTNTPTSWLWNFGDSTTSTTQNPNHQYVNPGTYTVSLKATNSAGSNTLTKTNYITVTLAAPVVAFNASVISGTAPLNVGFTDQSTNTPTSWLWHFGDNTTSNAKNPTHVYNSVGTYTVSLTATNSSGSNTLTKTNYIRVVTISANFTANPTITRRNVPIRFTNTSTGSPTSFLWSFGDGTSSTLQNPYHSYRNRGIYNVSLTITKSGVSVITTKRNYITIN